MKEILAEAERLTITYRSVTAVEDLSFPLIAGEILAVIGPNGSGKTSTIECLEGLRRPTAGTVRLLGKNPYRERRKLYQRVGIQLQDVEYPERIKVKELCRLFASFYERPADWRALLNQLGLMEKENRMVKKLSGGEKQRLSILLALLPRPKLLILDELTTGLDPEIRHGMWESLKQIRRAGTTILLVSHYLDEVEALADRLLYLVEGKKRFLGTQDEFRAYAKELIPAAVWKDTMPLEELYLCLSPKASVLNLEGIL